MSKKKIAGWGSKGNDLLPNRTMLRNLVRKNEPREVRKSLFGIWRYR